MPRLTPNIMILFRRFHAIGFINLLVVAVTVFLIFASGAGAQHSENFNDQNIEIVPGGALWLEGSASIVNYRCYAEQLEGIGQIQNQTDPKKNVQGSGGVKLTVSIPVKTLECGKKKMNRDMYEALKADRFPDITYQLLNADLVETIDDSNKMQIKTEGLLTIAGVSDTTEVVVTGQIIGEEQFRVTGSKRLNMHTFDIKPPTALLGLIKADETLTVHFDVTVRMRS